ncbi:MAG TPA: SAM-dependent chlorinase/fluorinase, partial [Thermoanaerobaculia bacterium]|nr:SAM-dependent chlorinase/fluorinase [Thermoanaerobaculia bacterium]
MAIIALLTDFGMRDPYVAAMKGVIASRCEARIEDLSHEVAAFDVFGAAWFLRAVVSYWPEGTIFVVVVDPGVGTARRILAAQQDGRVFLAPDNGVLSLVIASVASDLGDGRRADPSTQVPRYARDDMFSVEKQSLF